MGVFGKSLLIPGIILAGGLASRMGGGDKTLLKLKNKTILQHVIDRLAPQVNVVVLNANGNPERFSRYRVIVIPDNVDGFLGPLAGVLAGLDWAEKKGFQYIVTVAGDTPFFPRTLVSDLVSELQSSESTIALANTKPTGSSKLIRHPTFGIWSVKLRDDLRHSLNKGVRKVINWTEAHNHIDVLFDNKMVDPFFNVNTMEDLNTAKRIMAMGGK